MLSWTVFLKLLILNEVLHRFCDSLVELQMGNIDLCID